MTVILSGDKTRRNLPGNAFRRAKARLIKQGVKAGLVNRGAGARRDTGAGGGRAGDQASGRATSIGAERSDEFKHEDEDAPGDERVREAHLRRHNLARVLSRVSEEDSVSLGSSFVNSGRTIAGRDLESGGDGSSFRSPIVTCKGADEKAPKGVCGSGGKKDMPWSPIRGGRTKGSADDSGRTVKNSSGRRQTSSAPPRDKEAAQRTDRLDKARGPSIAARVGDCRTSMWEEREDDDDSGGDDGNPIPIRHSGGNILRTGSSSTLCRQRVIKNLRDTSSDMSGCVLDEARAHNDISWKEAVRDGVRPIDPFRRASVGRVHWPKRVRNSEPTGQANESSGGRVDGEPVQSTVDRSSSFKVDIAYSSGEDSKSDATAVAGDYGRSSRSHRRGISEYPFAESGVNIQPYSTARRKRHQSSRNRLAHDMAAEDLPGSSLEDVRTV